jgi:hypothetical protein
MLSSHRILSSHSAAAASDVLEEKIMKILRLRTTSVLAIFAGLVALPVSSVAATAAITEVSGLELVINSNTSSQVHNPVAAFNAAGQAMVVWENDLLGLRGRLYDAGGKPLGSEVPLVVNAAWSALPGSAPIIFHRDPAILFLPSGDFLLAWAQEKGSLEWTIFFENLEVTSREILVQRFTGSGQPVGQAHTISVPGSALKDNPRLALLPGGAGVMATWEGAVVIPAVAGQSGIFTRVLDVTGEPTADQIEVDQTSEGWEASLAALAVAPDGSYLVAWDSAEIANTVNTAVVARAFDAAGHPAGDVFPVSASSALPQMRPTLAVNGSVVEDPPAGSAAPGKAAGVAGAAGGKVTTYLLAYQSSFQDIWHAHVLGQVIDGSGNLLGNATTISSGANGLAEVAPTLVPAGAGTFRVVWMEYDTWFPIGMAGVHVDATGTPTDAEVWINNKQINSQFRTSLATDGAGNWIAPYEGFRNSTTVGILARFF